MWSKIVDEVEGTETLHQLPSPGTYNITFTNGKDGIGSSELEKQVDYVNRMYLAADIISMASPIATKYLLKKVDSDCQKKMVELFSDINLEPVKLAFGDKFQLDSFIKTLTNNVSDVALKCVPDANLSFLVLLKSLQKYFNLAEDTAELIFFIRDYLVSDIYGQETRYFYNGLSYGELFLGNISGSNNGVPVAQNEFVGEPDSQHLFKRLLSEEVYSYNISREHISTIKKETLSQNVADFPFLADKLYGDAEQIANSSTTVTDQNGNLEMTFKMGTVDSQFEIKPALQGNIMETVTLKPQIFNYEGSWLITVNNLDGSLHHYERIVFNNEGVSTYNETNIPSQNTGWYTTPYTYYINYNPSESLINIRVGTLLNFPFVVNSINDSRFYGDGDYYSEGYGEYYKLILDRE